MAQLTSRDPVRLTRRRRKALTRVACRSSGEFRQVQRARILLAAARKVPNERIAWQVGCTPATVRKVRRDYRSRGMRAGQTDGSRDEHNQRCPYHQRPSNEIR